METAQQVLYILGIIVLALLIIWMIAAIYLIFFLKKSIEHLNSKLNGLGGDLAAILFKGRKYLGVMGSGMIFKLITKLIQNRKRGRR
jgi:Na+-driven multidrug efflux pump